MAGFGPTEKAPPLPGAAHYEPTTEEAGKKSDRHKTPLPQFNYNEKENGKPQ